MHLALVPPALGDLHTTVPRLQACGTAIPPALVLERGSFTLRVRCAALHRAAPSCAVMYRQGWPTGFGSCWVDLGAQCVGRPLHFLS